PCIFCGISENPEEKSRKVYEDENYVAFHDINPSARLHILIVPRRHIENVMSLSIKDINMIREMKALGHMLLAKNQVPLKDHHLGFHVPPFTSVPHLHLHVIARPFKNWVRSAKYP
ncbi:HIT-like domain-containing protein, partial [Chytriomyces sp. MP71]